MTARALVAVLLVTLSACGTSSSPSSTLEPVSGTSAASTTQPDLEPPCQQGSSGFFGDGPLGSLTRESADAATVTGISLVSYSECEQLIVELAAVSGAPATSVGVAQAEFLRAAGIVRIHLDPAVTDTTVSDLVFDEVLANRVYVVRDFDGSLFIDLHVGAPAVARFGEVPNPARLIVDLAGGGSDVGTAHVADFVVVLPVSDPHRPLTGYGRTFEANVVLRVRQDGEIVAEDSTISTDYLETWGRFEVALPTGVIGDVEVFVGEDSARDGEEQGVRFDLILDSG